MTDNEQKLNPKEWKRFHRNPFRSFREVNNVKSVRMTDGGRTISDSHFSLEDSVL